MCCWRRVAAAVSVNGVVALPDPPCGQRSAVPYSARRHKYPFHASRAQPALRTTFYYLCHFGQMSNANARRKPIPHYYLLYRYISPPRTLLWASVETTSRVTLSRRRRTHAHLNAQLSCAFHPTPLRLSPEFNHKKTLPEGSAYCFKLLLSYLPFLSSFEGLALSPPETCTAISSISPLSLGLTMRRTMNAMKNAPARLNSTIEAMLFSSQLSSP